MSSDRVAGFSLRDPKESKVGAVIPLTRSSSLCITFSISYWSYRSAPFSVGGGYTEAHISGQKDNWGSSWRQTTTWRGGGDLENAFKNNNFIQIVEPKFYF